MTKESTPRNRTRTDDTRVGLKCTRIFTEIQTPEEAEMRGKEREPIDETLTKMRYQKYFEKRRRIECNRDILKEYGPYTCNRFDRQDAAHH